MKKGILILTLLILALFSVSCIYAADVNETLAANEDTGVIELSHEIESADDNLGTIEEQTVTQTDNEEKTGQTDNGTFQALKDKIQGASPGGTVYLENNYSCEDSWTQWEGISISTSNLIIDGKGHQIDAKGKARIFKIEADHVIIKNITFTNGYKDGEVESGAAIKLYGNHNCVVNCSFLNNVAWRFPALHMQGSNGTIVNCSFVNNTALMYGGAAYIQGEGGTVHNCSFVNNTASGSYCGALDFNVNNGNVTDCSFIHNTAASNTGALYLDYAKNVHVSGCIFINNTALRSAAASSALGENFHFSNCYFLNNTANNGVIYVITWGGQAQYFTIQHNIFLNNYAVGIVLDRPENTSNVDFNWFGNNATNYDTAPITKGTNMTTWLFLNATDCPDALTLLSSFTTSFKLYAYNNITKKVSEYDNSLVMPVNLTITQTNGQADDKIAIGGTVQYNATNIGKGSITAAIEDAVYTMEFGIKGDPALSVKSQEVNYSSNPIITLDYNFTATGTVNITLKGKNSNNYAFTNLALNATILLPEAINADEYVVNVAYSGDNAFLNATATGTLTVNKANSTLAINDNVTFDYNTNGSTTVSYTNASGVNASVMGQPNAIVVVNDTTITVSGLNAGNYTLTVTTITDANHNNITRNATIIVNKLQTQLTGNAIATTYNIDKNLVITLKDANGKALSGFKVTVDLNGAKTYTTDSNGQVKVSTKGLAPNVYTAKVTFDGNTNYDKSTKDVKVTVKKATPKLTAKKKTFKSSVKTKKYTVTLKDNTGKAIKKAKVTLKVKGKTYKATTNSKGKAVFKIKNLKKKGKYTAVIKFKGDKYYNKASKKVKIKVIVTFKTVSKGSKDKATVREIQQALKDKGYYLSYKGHYLMVDGKFESCTERSVKEFQHDKGLKVTGKVDEKTAKKLGII